MSFARPPGLTRRRGLVGNSMKGAPHGTTSRERGVGGGTEIAFELTGSGPSLVMVDSALGFLGLGPMGELAGLLARSFTVLTYDRQGRGESTDTPPYAVEREVEDLGALIDEAGGWAFVYGFSCGAGLGLHAARGLPIAKVAPSGPSLPLENRPEEGDLGAEIAELMAASLSPVRDRKERG
jgi:pimeloyl-ACP methyl ester carboxylesterase